MIISHKHQFIFIKTRKTAGSTLEKLLYPYLGSNDICTGSERDDTPSLNTKPNQNGHIPWFNAIKIDPIAWRSYYKFTIERNPWDKVVSSFFWHKKIKPQKTQNGFEDYVLTCDLLPRDWTLYAQEQNLMVDDVFKYEDMWSMYDKLNQKFGFDINPVQVVGTKMKSGLREVKDYKEMHTEKSIKKVEVLFHNEIKQFGYTYE